MLASLSIRDIVLIDRLNVEFEAGLTALTGETGAGKSILLDSLSLALGARGDASLVRDAAGRGQVTASFEIPEDHPVRRRLEADGIDAEGPLILRRQQSADGKTRAFINDAPVSVSLLRDVGRMLIEIHGQHDDRALIDPAVHRSALDAFGGLLQDAAEVSGRYAALRETARSLARLDAAAAEAEREQDYLRASVDELETLAPEPGEEEALAARRQSLMQAEKVAGDLQEAYESIAGSGSPIADLASLSRHLERKSASAPGLLEEILDGLGTALDGLERARAGLEDAMRQAEFDPGELERVEERLFAIRAAARKHRVAADDLPGHAAEMAMKLEALESSEERRRELTGRLAEERAAYREAALRLSESRRQTADRLESAVNHELPALKLDRARFIVDCRTDETAESADGFDSIAFHVQTNPGTSPGPMMKVASGGELSRFLLALKVVLADAGSAPTLIFDEIDTGVGGAVADAIGVRLARLASKVQVLAVTHAPQVAARARSHLLITKNPRDEGRRVATEVGTLADESRREEIARMLAGSVITEEARAAAGRLMKGAA